MKKKTLVAVLSVLMAGTMTFGLAGCSSCNDNDKPGNTPGGNIPDDNKPGGNTPDDNKPGNTDEMSMYERADYLARAVDDHYATYSGGEIFVAGYYNALEGDTEGYANCYEYSALLTMANKILAASTDEAQKAYYKKLLDGYVAGLDNFEGSGTYTSTHGTRLWENLYGVHRQTIPNTSDVSTDMVYDDLMWIIRDFIEIYHTTGDVTYIQRAEHLTAACLDGWDSTKGGIGGITWGPTYESKHTCSNGPLISALCGLADYYKDKNDTVGADETVYGEQTFGFDRLEWENLVGKKKYDYYLDWAKEVYNFTYSYLRDSDYTFIDLIRQDGAKQIVNNAEHPEQTYNYFKGDIAARTEGQTFTYNTGSVISGAAWLYRLTGEQSYLTQGRLMAEGAYHHFAKTVTVDGKEMQMYDCRASLLFNEVLMQGFYDLAKASALMESDIDEALQKEVAGYVNVFKSSIEFAFENYVINRTLPQNYLQGWLYAGEGGASTMDTHKDLKDAAATPAIIAIIAQYETEHGKISDILGEEEHEHSYTEWGSDENNHWLFCADDDEIYEDSRAPHVYDNIFDLECNECGYEREQPDTSHMVCSVSGKVTAGGTALAGATVTIGNLASVTTDSEGNYTVSGVSMATTHEENVTVTHPLCNDYSGKVNIVEGSEGVTHNITVNAKTVAALGNMSLIELNRLTATNAADYNFISEGQGSWQTNTTSYNMAGEGILFHEAGQDVPSGSTELKLFAYRRYTFDGIQQIIVGSTRFGDPTHNANLDGYPEVYLVLVAEDGTVITPNEDPGKVEQTHPTFNYCEFTFTEKLTGNYVLAVGTTRGNRAAIESLKFRGELVSGKITGTVKQGGAVLEGADVMFGSTTVKTGADGTFEIDVTVRKGDAKSITISKDGISMEVQFTAENLAGGTYALGEKTLKEPPLPGVTQEQLDALSASEATDNMPSNRADVQAMFRDQWVNVGGNKTGGEGWIFTDAGYADKGDTTLRSFAYKKLTFTNVQTIQVRARTFTDQNYIDGHGNVHPELILKLIDSQGNAVAVNHNVAAVNTDDDNAYFYFTLDTAISGDYVLAIGMARGKVLAIGGISYLKAGALTNGTVTGTVKGTDGEALEGAVVSYTMGFNISGQTTTASDGSFSLPVDLLTSGGATVRVEQYSEDKDVVASKTFTVTAAELTGGTLDKGEITLVNAYVRGLSQDEIDGLEALTGGSWGTDAIDSQWKRYGGYSKHGEGACIEVNEANSIAYFYAKVTLGDNDNYMKFNMRMFQRSSDGNGYLQVKVINEDGSVDILTPIRAYNGSNVISDQAIDGNKIKNCGEFYTEGVYDFTDYVGKTVVILIQDVTGDTAYNYHFAINDITFKSNSDTEFGKPAYEG